MNRKAKQLATYLIPAGYAPVAHGAVRRIMDGDVAAAERRDAPGDWAPGAHRLLALVLREQARAHAGQLPRRPAVRSGGGRCPAGSGHRTAKTVRSAAAVRSSSGRVRPISAKRWRCCWRPSVRRGGKLAGRAPFAACSATTSSSSSSRRSFSVEGGSKCTKRRFWLLVLREA